MTVLPPFPIAPSGGGGGGGTQTGSGSPVGVVTPSPGAGAVYSDKTTGNLWVALSASNSSWVLASAVGPVHTLTPSNSGAGSWQQMVANPPAGGNPGYMLYVVTLAAWADTGTTITFTNAFVNDVPGMLGTQTIPSSFYSGGMLSKTNIALPNTAAAAVTGTLLISGN